MTYEFLKSLYNDLISMLSGIVVKRNDLAKKCETIESIKAFDVYLACANGTRYFRTFAQFDEDILRSVLSPAQVKEAMIDPEMIPLEARDGLVKLQADRIKENYVEQNEYYRMLMGLPPLNDHHWIYVYGQPNIPEDVPIHKMSPEQISRLQIYGALDKVKAEHPEAEYLNYLGVNSIDLIEARLARPFDILRLGPSSNPRTVEMFKEEYYYARKYTLSHCYNPAEFNNKTLYEPIVGILMLTLAVRNTMVPDEADYLNFEEVLDAIIDSYGFLKYFKRFPYLYKRRLVFAMDKLLQVKGTDGVLVDVCKLFSDDDIIANRYYLLKYHAMNGDGTPSFTGDPNQDYILNFVRASIDEHDINTQEEYREDYHDIVDNDYLWQLTPDELTEYKAMDFNLMMSKYIDTESAFEITSLVFEVCCFINLLLYARENLAKVFVENVYATDGRCTLFAMLNFLLAAMAQYANFDGNIVYSPMDIAEIWRFNYDDIEDRIRAIVDKYELQIDVDNVLLEGFEMELDKPAGVMGAPNILETYIKNRALYEAICEEMKTTTDIRQYIALADCRDMFFTSATEMETFTKSDGSIAQTYREMLWDVEPTLAAKLDEMIELDPAKKEEADDKMRALIIYILERLEALFNSDELHYLWLNTPTIYANIIGKYLLIAINVFKASSVQLRSVNVFFKLGDLDPIRILDEMHRHKDKVIDDYVHIRDDLSKAKTRFIDDYISFGDKVYTNMYTVRHKKEDNDESTD